MSSTKIKHKVRDFNIIRNTDLYARVGDVPWSGKIRTRRLLLLGHLQRLHPETPARRALHERLRDLKRPRGGQKSNWVGVVNKDLKEKGLNTVGSEASIKESADRKFWRSRILKERAVCEPITVIVPE